jgi:iron(III) transport system substrate-binding protein
MSATTRRAAVVLAAIALSACGEPRAETATLNVYSARHYDSDDAFYAAFEAATGARVRRIEADGDLLIEKVRAEGEASPADVVITVDVGRLQRAEEAGLFQPIRSAALESAIPAHLRHPDGYWFAFAKRARVIVYRDGAVDPARIDSYEELADPALAGRICVRSSSNIYNVSLLSALIARWGPERAEAWARGVRNNFARLPTGGDTDQIAAVAAGECDVAVVNHYYFARMLEGAPEQRATAALVKLIWPDQDGAGAHVNISGAGVAANAPHPELAQRFLEFMLEPAQQELLSSGSFEYPILAEAAHPAALDGLGVFREEEINVSEIGAHQAEAARLFDVVGWP